jgi:hypothetical protein
MKKSRPQGGFSVLPRTLDKPTVLVGVRAVLIPRGDAIRNEGLEIE